MSQEKIDRIAAAVIQRQDGKVLLLKRADTHTTNPGKWCFVTGYVKAGESPRAAAIRELKEELDLDAEPVRDGQIVLVYTSWGAVLNVYPFLFSFQNPGIRLDREHTEYRWIDPGELYQFDFVQQLDEDLINLGLLPAKDH